MVEFALGGVFTAKPCISNSPTNNLRDNEYKIKFIALKIGALLTLVSLEKTPKRANHSKVPYDLGYFKVDVVNISYKSFINAFILNEYLSEKMNSS